MSRLATMIDNYRTHIPEYDCENTHCENCGAVIVPGEQYYNYINQYNRRTEYCTECADILRDEIAAEMEIPQDRELTEA